MSLSYAVNINGNFIVHFYEDVVKRLSQKLHFSSENKITIFFDIENIICCIVKTQLTITYNGRRQQNAFCKYMWVTKLYELKIFFHI